ncbi:MAG: peptidoglycan-binding protein [Alphaproteobacteria bacterium]|nr:peptidoglycan-binding protein [Alphaproteobacteria bacterium]
MRTAIVVALCLSAAACGSNTEQRSASGGLTGAGVGALVGGPVGAIVGAAAGGAGGAVAPEGADQAVNQGLHAEHRAVANVLPQPTSGSSTAQSSSSANSETTAPMTRETVMKIQTELRRDGDYKGRIDGIFGPRSRIALRNWQSKQNLPATGELDQQTMQRLTSTAPPNGGASGTSAPAAGPAPQTPGQAQQ